MTQEQDRLRILVAAEGQPFADNRVGSLRTHPSEPRIEVAIGSERAIRVAEERKPGVVLVAANIGPADGFAVVRQIVSRVPGVSCLLLAQSPDNDQFRQALRVGARDMLTLPVAKDELFRAIDAAWEVSRAKRDVLDGVVARAEEAPRAKGIVVFSTKGGTGKTFLSINLAAGLAAAGKRVALVDLDLQFGDDAIALGLVPERTVFDLVRGYTDFDLTLLRDFMITHGSGLQLLPAPLYPDEAEQISAHDVERILETLSAGFDYVIVDTPPFFEERILVALEWADHILNVGSLDLPTIKNLKIGFTMMNLMAFPEDKLWIVMNRADSRVGVDTAEAEKHLGMKVRFAIPSSIDVPKALNAGEALLLAKPGSTVSLQLQQIVGKLAGNGNSGITDPAETRKRIGLFRR